eukprot:1525876-Alexandrium_andersonii.AAC.1
MEGGAKPPESYEAWTDAVGRDKRWIDGLAILAAARRFALRIVLVDRIAENTPAVYSFGKRDQPPAIVL